MEEIRTVFAAIALAVSVASMYVARRAWIQSNRPIVTAAVVEYDSGDEGAVFNLFVSNTGNRPATNIRLKAKPEEIDKLLTSSEKEKKRQSSHDCFSDKAMLPLLRNGEELTTSFGSIRKLGLAGEGLLYDSEIPIEITYKDLEGRDYRSRLTLKVHSREGFGGSVWK